MTAERWQQVKNVLEAALLLDSGEQRDYLDRACSSDQSLRREVESLLAANDEVRTGFLQSPPPRLQLQKGARLGDYEIQSLLGAGGMGEVYRARDPRLRRDVAVKVLPSFFSSDKERLRRFEQEAQAAAALNHPNILAVFQMGTYEGAPYLVSELLEGDTLRGQIGRGPMAVRKAIDYGVQIAHGLAAAHEKGIVHRDLKPENLFATKDGRIKILDFGLAKLKQPETTHQHTAPTAGEAATEPGMVMGTAGYMSPEQVRGKDVDHRTDIFSFGAILYELLTGKRAFQKTTSADTMSAILNEEPAPLSQVVAKVPPALQRTVHRCLEKSPELRFQSASDLAFALEALSDSVITPLPRAGTAPSTTRHSLAAALAMVITALLIGGVVWRQLPGEVPRVEGVRQLTDDGEPKLGSNSPTLLTDGLRVYFAEGMVQLPKVVQVSATGGQTTAVPMRFKYAGLLDLAPDASALLIDPVDEQRPWIQPLPAGEARSLPLDTDDAKFVSDGRVVFALGSSLYIANADGSNQHKLVDAQGGIDLKATSPHGERIRFNVAGDNDLLSMWEVNTNGTGLRRPATPGVPEVAQKSGGSWTHDGKYFLFQAEQAGRWDLWALPANGGLFHRSANAVRLTNGPLSYEGPVSSRDGKQIFAVGSKKRGELIRYDSQSGRFVPYLSGVSAVETQVSPDGKWVLYISYPERTLWRCRSDGTECVQLTFAPMMIFYPRISPDGSKVAFNGFTNDSGLGVYLLNAKSGTPVKVVEEFGHAPTWSPDGNSLAYAAIAPGHHFLDGGHWLEIHVVNLQSKRVSVIPTDDNWFAPWWPQPDKLVAAASVQTTQGGEPHLFDFRTHKWSKLGGDFGVLNWAPSPDGKYLYLLTGDSQSNKVQRLRASDFKIEVIADVAGVRIVFDDSLGQASGGWIGLAADGSPTLTHDVGSDEIYALDVKWP
jgi:eukaryotic-like serine/threonine-protein kinase